MARHAKPRNRYNVIAIGDTTLDVFLHIHEATVSCQLNKQQCLLCLEYAEKIPVEYVVKVPGAGNASNAAVGACRLKLRTAIVSIIGRDDIGEDIVRGWKREGVAQDYVLKDPKHGTNYSTVLSFQGERTILVYSQPRTYRLPKIDGADWIYYTALGAKHEHLEKQLLAHLKRHPKQKLVFNPGTAHLHRGLKALKPVIARSDLLILNREEAARLLEDGERPITNMLMSFRHLGAKTVIITDGPKGSYATNDHEVWSCPIFPGKIVERTGAGDSFAIGALYGMFHGFHLREVLRIGTANAWSVVQKIGPQAGLLDERQLYQTLKRFQKIQPKLLNHIA